MTKKSLPLKSPAPAQPQSRKLLYLEGLRGLAALWVFFIHFNQNFAKDSYQILLGYQSWKASVPLFFILSGRVLTASVLRSQNPRQLMSAILRRPLRLFLPMVSVLPLDVILYWMGAYSFVEPASKLSTGFWSVKDSDIPTRIQDYLVQPFLFMFTNVRKLPERITGVVWTLGEEYNASNYLYFLTFALLQFQDHHQARYLIYALTFLWSLWTGSWNYFFIFGLFLADMDLRGYVSRFMKWKYASIVQILLFVGTSFLAFDIPHVSYGRSLLDPYIRSVQINPGDSAFGLPGEFWVPNFLEFLWTGVVVFLLETVTWLQVVFAWSPFVYLGRISYMMYLFHQYYIRIVPAMLVVWLFPIMPINGWRVVVVTVLSVLGLVIVSEILTRIVDMPTVIFCRWVERVVFIETWSWRRVRGFIRKQPIVLYYWWKNTLFGFFQWWASLLTAPRRGIRKAQEMLSKWKTSSHAGPERREGDGDSCSSDQDTLSSQPQHSPKKSEQSLQHELYRTDSNGSSSARSQHESTTSSTTASIVVYVPEPDTAPRDRP